METKYIVDAKAIINGRCEWSLVSFVKLHQVISEVIGLKKYLVGQRSNTFAEEGFKID